MVQLIGSGASVAVPWSVHLLSLTGFQIPNNDRFFSRIIDITDLISDPENPLTDYGDFLNVTLTRAWYFAWSVRLDLPSFPWLGTSRVDLYLHVLNFTRSLALSEASEDLIRLFIPAVNNVYVYTGYSLIHSQRARIEIENRSGATVQVDVDLWAKGWP